MIRLAALLGLVIVLTPLAAQAEVDFRRDVAPILVKRCLGCHNEQQAKGEFRLHTLTALQTPGETGEAPVVPGKPEASYLLSLLEQSDADLRMPKDADPLAAAEIETLRQWIAAGAKTDDMDPTQELVSTARWPHPLPPATYTRPLPITSLAFRPDGQEIAVGGLHEMIIFHPADGRLLRRIPGLAERVYELAYTEDGSKLVVAGGTPGQVGEAKLLDAESGALITHFGSMLDCALAVSISPDQKRLAVGGADHALRIYEMTTGKQMLALKQHVDWVMAVAWSPDGSRLATASRDKTCKIFDSHSGELITTFTEHNEPVYSVAWHPDGKHAISGGADHRIRYWIADDPGWENPEKMDKKKRHQTAEIGGFSAPVHRLRIAGGQLFACSADRSVRQFRLEDRVQVRSYSGHDDWVYALDHHAGSQRLASGSIDGRVRLWQTSAQDEKERNLLGFVAAPGFEQDGPAPAPPNE